MHTPTAPLVSLDEDLQAFITELKEDLKKVDEFFEGQLREMVGKYESMYRSFEKKVREGSEEFHRKTFKHEAHDGLDYASSWGRVFNDVYTTVSWLEGFATINHNAALKIIKKFSKNFFTEKENPIQQKLKGASKRYAFANLDEIIALKKKIRSQFAYHFTNKDISKAQKMLEVHMNKVNPRDLFSIAFFAGTACALLLVIAYFLFIPAYDNKFYLEEI